MLCIVRSVNDLVIRIEHLVKTFGPTRALDDLDLDVAAGEVHGFLGPNGAGKSTTIRALLGLLRTDSGSMAAVRPGPVGRQRRDPPPARVRAGRRRAVAEPVRRRDHRHAAPDAGHRPASARARDEMLERFDLDPTKRGRSLLQGQPSEGRAGGGVGRGRRPARARRADLGPGPAHGAGLRRHPRRAGPAARARPCCSPATSSARWSGWLTASRSSARDAPWRAARWPSCGTCGAARWSPRSPVPCPTSPRMPGVTTSASRAARSPARVEPDAMDRRAGRAPRRGRAVA